MESVKDICESLKFRTLANAFFNDGDYQSALLNYNKSICFASSGSLDASLGFANRSAVYLKIGEYERCLKNIQLARMHGYPAKDLNKLNQREKTCKRKMRSGAAKPSVAETMLKLTYEANAKLPFASGCLKLSEDGKLHQHIITDRDLKVGDIIAIEPVFVATTAEPWRVNYYDRCFSCFKSEMMDLLPCKGFNYVMFCSKTCIEEFESFLQFESQDSSRIILRLMNKVHSVSNGSVNALSRMVSNPKKNLTVFDFDLSDEGYPSYDQKRLLAFCHLMEEQTPSNQANLMFDMVYDKLKKVQKFQNFLRPRYGSFVEKLIKKLYLVRTTKGFVMNSASKDQEDEKSFAAGVYPFLSLISHSCAPNCRTVNVIGDKMMLFVTSPIKQGEALTVSYHKKFNEDSYDERQTVLREWFSIDCSCVACVEKYAISMEEKNENHQPPPRNSMHLTEEMWSEFNWINQYVQEHHDAHFPCSEIVNLTEKNVCNVERIASDWIKFQV